MDAQASLDDVAALAALVHGLAIHAAEDGPAAHDPPEGLAWSSFRAARDGLDATLHVNGDVLPLRAVARRAGELARPPRARAAAPPPRRPPGGDGATPAGGRRRGAPACRPRARRDRRAARRPRG